jgi:hypothetical protein
MIARQRLSRLLASSVLGLMLCGCGTSGSNPPELPEVHFLVTPLGSPASFTVNSIETGGLSHPSINDQEFDDVTGPIDFVVEGALSPYTATFTRTQTSTHEIRVELSFVPSAAAGGSIVSSEETSGAVNQVIVKNAPAPIARAPALETRVDVCVLVPGTASCLTANPATKSPITDPGVTGQTFTASIGDAFGTHLGAGAVHCTGITCTNGAPTSPTIYFLEGAQENLIAVFHPFTLNQVLLARLYLNGALVDAQSGANEDVVLRQDL